MSVGLTIFSTDSTTFLLPLFIIIDSKIISRIFLALLLHIILLSYGLLRIKLLIIFFTVSLLNSNNIMNSTVKPAELVTYQVGF